MRISNAELEAEEEAEAEGDNNGQTEPNGWAQANFDSFEEEDDKEKQPWSY